MEHINQTKSKQKVHSRKYINWSVIAKTMDDIPKDAHFKQEIRMTKKEKDDTNRPQLIFPQDS